MGRAGGPALVALATGLLLAALSLVTWRQSRALAELAELDAVRREWSLVQAVREEQLRRIQHLESRRRVVPEAQERLGLQVPDDSRMVLLEREVP